MIITAMSSKGGVAKTTTLLSLAAYWADQEVAAGRSVLILDVDPNAPLATFAKRHPLKGVQIIAVQPRDFTEVFDQQAKNNDYFAVMIDLPGFSEEVSFHAVGRSHFVIVPAGNSELDFVEAVRTMNKVKAVSKTVGREIRCKLLLTRVPPLSNRVTGHFTEIIEKLNIPAFSGSMIERISYKSFFSNGVAPHTQDAKARAELSSISKEIIGDFIDNYLRNDQTTVVNARKTGTA